MIEIYKTNDVLKKVEKTDKIEKGVWINMYKPTKEEIKYIVDSTKVHKHFIEKVLDEEERSHIDVEENQVLVSINLPIISKISHGNHYTTIPLGMISAGDDYFITVSSEGLDVLDNLIIGKIGLEEVVTYKKSRIIFQILYKVAGEYIKYIDKINQDIEKFEHKLEKTMQNKELIKLIYFQKSMIYFDAALKTNQTVIEKLRRGKIIRLYEEDEELLEDVAIENRQAMEMLATYSEILNGMIEVFSAMVSNNLNIVMKFLTSITILISIPTLIASILGMNVVFPFSTTTAGFWGIIVVSILATILSWRILKNKDMM